MSEPKLVSPLLDGCIMGEAISDHHGVRCYPAIRENTDECYIIKIISIPATQVQMDALLLTGACADQAAALVYFKELSDGVIGEADILDRLSRLEGFSPYLGHQIEQMEEGTGYEVYLMSPYRRSLEKLMRTEPLTHLAAVNLGLDMCAALAVCRRAGYLYADLKPSNIFLSESQGYHIGDLGFISLSSLKYASLPEKYRSSYIAPEITDAMSALNSTIDIYALGLTLYQVYNNGELPFEGSAPAQILPPPMYADYEMAEIILKACAPDPADRWQDPAQMGQALVNYMQRNSVNDTPIVPPPVLPQEETDEPEEFLSEEENDAELAELLAMIPDEEEPPQQQPKEPTDEETRAVEEDIPAEENAPDEPIVPDREDESASETSDEPQPPIEDDTAEPEQLSFVNILEEDETTPSEENTATLEGTPVTDEVAQMLAQADDLIAHELPEPVVAPAPIDVPIPPPIVTEPEPEEEAEEPAEELMPVEETEKTAEESETEAEAVQEEPMEVDTEPEEIWDEEEPKKKSSARRWIAAAVVALVLVALGFGGYWFYNHYYLQTIDAMDVLGSDDTLTVQITSDVADDLLTVVCTDTYGNAKRSAVTNGTAVFSDLNPGTQYRIQLEISGLHKLVGPTTGSYTTAAQTEILNLTAVSGPEDGSVILNFSVKGPDPGQWTLVYSTPGEEPNTTTFTGHTVTVTGLTVGSEYTFDLENVEGVFISGTDTLNYTAQNVIYAQDLTVTACGDGSMTVQWAMPEGVDRRNWIVRCYNDAGYDQTLTTSETTISFTGLDHTTGYTVLVTAEGMTQSVTTKVTADPINVTGFNATSTDPWAMTLTWDYTGTTPAGGWLLTYTVDGGEAITLTCAENSAVIALAPGCTYAFEVRPVDEITYFTVPYTYGPVEIATFEGYYVTAANMSFTMYLGSVQQNTFAAGDKASLKGKMNSTYGRSDDNIVSTFVIRDAQNGLVSAQTSSRTWEKLWKKRACTLDIPQLPTDAGTYTLDLYFNNMYVTSLSFTIA